MKSKKFCRPRCVFTNLDFCTNPKDMCNETGLKYDRATQNEVGMEIKSQIEIKTKPGYICKSFASQLRLNL